jgi:hypothetical protein
MSNFLQGQGNQGIARPAPRREQVIPQIDPREIGSTFHRAGAETCLPRQIASRLSIKYGFNWASKRAISGWKLFGLTGFFWGQKEWFKKILGPALCLFCCYYGWLPWSDPERTNSWRLQEETYNLRDLPENPTCIEAYAN